jgi:hypothetical protein
MNETYVDRMRAVTDYIAQHDMPKLIAVSVDQMGNKLHGSDRDGKVLPAFLTWAETLDGGADITAEPVGSTYHLTATGTAAGTPLTLLMIVRGDEYKVLHEELTGHAPGAVPLTRTQLAKIADPELLDDRAEATS